MTKFADRKREMTVKRALLFTIFAAAAAAAEGNSVAGKWAIHYNISGYEGDMDCDFTQEGTDLGGSCTSTQGSVRVTGKVEETKLNLQYKTEYNGDELTVTYTGKREPGKMSGSISVQPMGVEGEFTGTQAK